MWWKKKRKKDDKWIMEHSTELKAELLKRAKEGKPRPKPDTVLGRALELFTNPNAVAELDG